MIIRDILHKNKSGAAIGLPSFCSSNMFVIDAALDYVLQKDVPIVIEATCNQINQFGGYTGILPKDFSKKVRSLATEKGIEHYKLILGGDHLGPNPWKHLSASKAMQNAQVMVKDYVQAGFTKIHLDASMPCKGENTLSFEEVARRTSELCMVAEKYAPDLDSICYVIGTEVPIPGGETETIDMLQVTSPERLDRTIETHMQAFKEKNLQAALSRIVSVVVQPGVDFSHTAVTQYSKSSAKKLVDQLSKYKDITFEAHSTDYQQTTGLANLVADHHLFLKVGPELTFALREALFLLSKIEDELFKDKASNLIQVVFKTMDNNPKDWINYYHGSSDEQQFLKHYSYSDRIRYYWDHPDVNSAINKMIKNLDNVDIPEFVISQFFGIATNEQNNETARSLIKSRIQYVVGRYYNACGLGRW